MRKLLLTGISATFAAGAVFAQLPSFEEVDTNGDGQIDQEEAAAIEGLQFDVVDVDGDGVVDRQEWEELSTGAPAPESQDAPQ